MRIDTNIMKPKLTMTNTPPCKHEWKHMETTKYASSETLSVHVLYTLICKHCGQLKHERTEL